MELIDILDMPFDEAVNWIEDNNEHYKLEHKEPQWNYCSSNIPDEPDQMYWVRDELNGNIKICHLNEYPYRSCWQGLDNTDFDFTDTSWIMIKRPEY